VTAAGITWFMNTVPVSDIFERLKIL